MKKEEAKNCWELMDCDLEVRNACPAYTLNEGKNCFLIASHYCLSHNKKLDFKHCPSCPWFKKNYNSTQS